MFPALALPTGPRTAVGDARRRATLTGPRTGAPAPGSARGRGQGCSCLGRPVRSRHCPLMYPCTHARRHAATGRRGSSGFTRLGTAGDAPDTGANRATYYQLTTSTTRPRPALAGTGTHNAQHLVFGAQQFWCSCAFVYALGALIALWLSPRVATPSAFLLTPLETGRAGQCCFSRAALSMGALLGLESRWAAPCSNRSSMPPLLTCGMRSRPTSPRCLGARFR